jgi:hypothetical protein
MLHPNTLKIMKDWELDNLAALANACMYGYDVDLHRKAEALLKEILDLKEERGNG